MTVRTVFINNVFFCEKPESKDTDFIYDDYSFMKWMAKL